MSHRADDRRRRPLAMAVAGALVGLATAAAAQAPIPIAERFLTVGSRTVRTSLFSNRVAVVSVRLDGKRVMLRRTTLSETEHFAYLAAIQRDAEELAAGRRRPGIDSLGGHGEIILHVGPDAPRTVRYSPVEVLDLATTRLVAALDDLELRVLEGQPLHNILLDWQPRPGDRVELANGVLATVTEVWKDGTVVVEHDDSWISEQIPAEHIPTIIRRLVAEAPP